MHADCADGCLSAYWRRPELYLKAEAHAAISTFHWIPDDARKAGLQRLEADLASGAWADRNAELLDLGYRLIVADV